MLSPLVETLNNMRVVLATSSKQRIEVLAKTLINFEVKTSNYEENLDRTKYTFTEYVELTALGKVNKVYQDLKNEDRKPDLIIGLDTMICSGNNFFGKPKDKEDAIQTIRRLSSDTPHTCITGVAIFYKGNFITFHESTIVFMEILSDEEILTYVETGESMGKAGAYAIQGLASSFVTKIEGDYNNVIGLPLCRITKELKKLLNDQTMS